MSRQPDTSYIKGGCFFCEGTGRHFGQTCGACDSTGKEIVRKQKQKVYNSKNGLPINTNINIDKQHS